MPPHASARLRTHEDAGLPVSALRLAHRGDWRRAPENSLEAMRAALAMPACDGLEFDIRSSRDGVPVLLHDATLERVQGVPAACADLTAAELERHGAPTLAAVLALADGADHARDATIEASAGAPTRTRRPFLDVELKEPANEAFFEVLGASRGRPDGTLDRAVVSSFQPEIVAGVRAARPGWAVWGNALDLDPATIEVATKLGFRGLSVRWRAITPAGAARARDAGLELAAWTVRRRPTFDRLERLGVDAVCVEAAALDGRDARTRAGSNAGSKVPAPLAEAGTEGG
jgi:glycerophosphoryl diester phosphodiesterase